jgi:hypothetical protein
MTDKQEQDTAGVRVKPLRWKGPDSSGEYHSLDGLWGYIIRAENGYGFWLTEAGGYYFTPEGAQTAAQADYEQRILSALTTS